LAIVGMRMGNKRMYDTLRALARAENGIDLPAKTWAC
jgi:hypothetical protein